MINYDGPGTYFNLFIRDNYPNRKIGGEDEFLSVIDPNQLNSSKIYEENPELERGAEWIINAEKEGAPPELIDQVRNNMGISNLKLEQLRNSIERQPGFNI